MIFPSYRTPFKSKVVETSVSTSGWKYCSFSKGYSMSQADAGMQSMRESRMVRYPWYFEGQRFSLCLHGVGPGLTALDYIR